MNGKNRFRIWSFEYDIDPTVQVLIMPIFSDNICPLLPISNTVNNWLTRIQNMCF